MSKSNEENIIINIFKEKFNLDLVKIQEGDKKTPDFEGFFDGKLRFYMELKTIEVDTFTDGVRNDPVFNRISSKIHNAFKQLNETNQDHLNPNILLLYNYDDSIDETYLDNITTNMFFADDGSSWPIYKQYTRRIKDERGFIDLYMWYQNKDNRLHFRFWNSAGDNYYNSLCEYFGIKPLEVQNIKKRYQ